MTQSYAPESFTDLSIGDTPKPVRLEKDGPLYPMIAAGTITTEQLIMANAVEAKYGAIVHGMQNITTLNVPEARQLRADLQAIMVFSYTGVEPEVLNRIGDLVMMKAVKYFLEHFDPSSFTLEIDSLNETERVIPMAKPLNGARRSPKSSRSTAARTRAG